MMHKPVAEWLKRHIGSESSLSWSRARILALLTIGLWVALGQTCSVCGCVSVWLPDHVSQDRLLGLLTVLAALQIPVLLFLLDKILKQKFLLRKILPRTVYFRETVTLLITANVLAYISPNINYAFLPLLLVIGLSYRTIYIAVNIATQPEDYMDWKYLRKITQQITHEDYVNKTTATSDLPRYKGLKMQLSAFVEAIEDIEMGLKYHMEQSNLDRYRELLDSLCHMAYQIDSVYQLQASNFTESELEQLHDRLTVLNTATDRVRIIIRDQLIMSTEKDSYDFALLLMDRAYRHLSRSHLGREYNFTELIRYNDIMMWWLNHLTWHRGENHKFTDSREELLEDFLQYINLYPTKLQDVLRDPFGKVHPSGILALRTLLRKSIIPTLHITTHNFLVGSDYRRDLVPRFLEIVVNLQERFRSCYAFHPDQYAEPYLEEMRHGLVLVMHAIQNQKSFKEQYDNLNRLFLAGGWREWLCYSVRFIDRQNNSSYNDTVRVLLIKNLYGRTIRDLDLTTLSSRDQELLQQTSFFSQYVSADGTNSFLDNLKESRLFKRNKQFKDLQGFIKQLAHIRKECEQSNKD